MLKRDGDGDTVDYHAVRRAVACRWLRLPIPPVDGVPAELLEEVMSHIAPRVAAETADGEASEQPGAEH